MPRPFFYLYAGKGCFIVARSDGKTTTISTWRRSRKDRQLINAFESNMKHSRDFDVAVMDSG